MNSLKTPNKQHGAVLVLTALSLFVLMGMAGLAIDIGHTMVNKTIAQNAADAAALSAAIRINQHNDSDTNADEIAAEAEGKATYNLFKGSPGNGEISEGLSADDLTFTFAKVTDLSTTSLGDWHEAAATNGAGENITKDTNFVRVTTAAVNVNAWFAGVVGFPELAVSTSAVAGVTPIAPCDLAPILMCADVDAEGKAKDTNCGDDTNANGTLDCYGYELENLYCMTDTPAGGGGGSGSKCALPGSYGPGNIGLLTFDKMFPDIEVKGGGGALIQECLAGNPECQNLCESSSPNSAITKPGGTTGPFVSGIDSLFNNDHPELGYPSDTVTGYGDMEGGASTEPTLVTYADVEEIKGSGYLIPTTGIPLDDFNDAEGINPFEKYVNFTHQAGADSHASEDAVDKKRVFSVPFVDCSKWGTETPSDDEECESKKGSGTTCLPIVGYGCFWVAAPTEKQGSYNLLLGAFIGNKFEDKLCQTTGNAVSDKDYDFYKVILYKDPYGGHS
jgi:Flp pilus assembly protein TadG